MSDRHKCPQVKWRIRVWCAIWLFGRSGGDRGDRLVVFGCPSRRIRRNRGVEYDGACTGHGNRVEVSSFRK